MVNKTQAYRVIMTVLFGIFAGMVVSFLILFPPVFSRRQSRVIEGRLQLNLVNAGGLAHEYVNKYRLEIAVVNTGGDVAEASVSPDGFRWYTPVNGVTGLELPRGDYAIRAAYKNKLVYADYPVSLPGDSRVELDISDAPEAAEIVFYELTQGQDALIPLEIRGADELTLKNEPSGFIITKDGGGYYLAISGDLLTYGFLPFTATASNGKGSAETWICVIVPRDTPVIAISTVEELAAISRNLSGNYYLANDLDITGIDLPQIGSESNPFTGVFDGGGNTIWGYSASGHIELSGILGYCNGAIIKNLIVRDVYIDCEMDDESYNYSAICSASRSSLFLNCASIGGSINIFNAHAGGIVGSSYNNVIIGCFNSTDIINNTPNPRLPNTGGIASSNSGYTENCSNEGTIYGNHLTAGITGFHSEGTINRCLNTGVIYGRPIMNRFPAGAIMQTIDSGRVSYGYFIEGASAAGRVFTSGAIIGIKPLDRMGFRDRAMLASAGSFDGDAPDWAYASLDAFGPVPFGIFKERAPAPEIIVDGRRVEVPAAGGVKYFYSVDGSDPYKTCYEGVDSISLTLRAGQVFRVFSAKSGMRDSEVVEYGGSIS